MAEKIVVSFLILSIAGVIFLCFAINLYLGISVLLLRVFTFWFYLEIKKKS